MTFSVEKQKQEIKNFLQIFAYNIMHESGKNEVEHYFVVITKDDINTPILKQFFDMYVNEYPLLDVSKQTKEFIQSTKDRYYFVLIDSLSHKDPLFQQKDNLIRDNANNIICVKMIGEVADVSSHLGNTLDVYLEQFKNASVSFGQQAKSKALKTIQNGKTIIEDKTPIIKQNIIEIGDKISERIKKLKNRI